jgi:CRISPR-associated protein Csb2
LWSPEGFGEEEQTALRELSALPPLKGQGGVRLLLDYVGEDDVHPLRETAAVWRSWTPYLPSRHGKKDGRESAREQLLRECEQRGLPAPVVSEMESDGLEYEVHRGPRPGPGAAAAWFRLELVEAITGPLTLGAQSHFGMGRFVPLA